MSAWADVAVLTGTKTLDGRLVARSVPGLPFLLSEGMDVHFVPPVIDMPRCARVTSVDESASGDYVLSFDEITSKTVAGQLVGCHCLIEKRLLSLVYESYLDTTFMDYGVYSQTGELIGRVVNVQEMPTQILLTVLDQVSGKSHLIPLVEDWVLDVSSTDKTLQISIPAGLLDL